MTKLNNNISEIELSSTYIPQLEFFESAARRLKGVATVTRLESNLRHSEHLGAIVYLKREDQQVVRSFKIRGAFNKIRTLSKSEQKQGVICASAGNHAQGVAYSCNLLRIRGTIVMPTTTTKQKIDRVRFFGKDFISVLLHGNSYDEADREAEHICRKFNSIFVHPFDDPKVIEGQGTVGIEIYRQMSSSPDFVLVAIGGGGLAAGVASVLEKLSPNTKVIGVEPSGALSMKHSFDLMKVSPLEEIDNFVDGAAVKQVGNYTFPICMRLINRIIEVPEGRICQEILDSYNNDGIVLEPAGAMVLAALDQMKQELSGKKVVCIIGGGNNDFSRLPEIHQRASLFSCK